MLIKNITGNTTKNAAKVIGIGNVMIQPDEEKMVPDSMAYVNEVDDEGRQTGKKVILPAILAQAKMGMISYKETGKKPAAKAETPAEEPAEEERVTYEIAAAAEEDAPKKAARRAAKKAE